MITRARLMEIGDLAAAGAKRLGPAPVLAPTAPSAEEIAAIVVEQMRTPAPAEITGREAQASGLVSRRTFLAAARDGRLVARKRGREFVALREDVERFARSLRVTPRPPKRASVDPVREQIEGMLDAGRLRVVRGGKR